MCGQNACIQFIIYMNKIEMGTQKSLMMRDAVKRFGDH